MGDIVRQHEAPPMAQKLLQRLQDHIDRLGPYRHSAIQKARNRSRLYDLFNAVRLRDKLELDVVGDWGE